MSQIDANSGQTGAHSVPYGGTIMVITIPLGATILFMLARLAVGAALAVMAMRQGMSPSLRVGWTLKFNATPAQIDVEHNNADPS